MKELKDIESLSLEQLEEISRDEDIAVPADLETAIMSSLKKARTRQRMLRWPLAASAAACFAALVVAGTIHFTRPSVDLYAEPQDTFSDPVLACAALESALGRIGTTVGDGIDRTAAFGQTMEKASMAIR